MNRVVFAARRAAPLALMLCSTAPGLARASGFDFVDQGAAGSARAGAFSAKADDPSALYYNPGGLTQLQGFHFGADLTVARHGVEFLRTDPDGAALKNETTVKNSAPATLLPLGALTYGLKLAGKPFTVGAGIYPPPSIAKHAFNSPNYERAADGSYLAHPGKNAPQRYGLIDNDLMILYPSAVIAYEIFPFLSLGLAVQAIYADMRISQAVYDAPPEMVPGGGPSRMAQEDPTYDSVVTLHVKSKLIPTGTLGLRLRDPSGKLFGGLVVSLGRKVHGEGTLNVQLSEFSRTTGGATVNGDQASLDFSVPTKVRAAVGYAFAERMDAEIDVVWEGWSAVDEFVITPHDIAISSSLLAAPLPLPTVHIPRRFKDTVSLRLGGSYGLPFSLPVSLSAGVAYETSSMPSSYTGVDFANFSSVVGSGGVSVGLGPVDLLLATSYIYQPSLSVRDSQLPMAASFPGLKANMIGNGDYRSSYVNAAVGLRGSL